MTAQGAGQPEPVNNPGSDPAVEGEGASPVLDELYDTLADVQRGIDLRNSEAEDLQKQVLEAQQQLNADRDEAQQADDPEAYKTATEQLEELNRAWLTLSSDLAEEQDDDERKPESKDVDPLPGGPHGGGGEDVEGRRDDGVRPGD